MTAEPTPLHQPLLQALDDLEAQLSDLRSQYGDPGDRMEAFATLADPILAHASLMDCGHDHDGCFDMVANRIDEMLKSAGWIDEQGQVTD